MNAIVTIGPAVVLAPEAHAGRAAVIGVSSAPSFSGACSLVVHRGALRLHADLTADQVEGFADVAAMHHDLVSFGTAALAADGTPTPVYIRREGPSLLITVGVLRLQMTGADLRRKLHDTLYHRRDGHGTASGECEGKAASLPLTLTQTEADQLGIHPGLYQVLVVDRRPEGNALVVVVDVLGDAGGIVGRLSRRYGGGQ